MAWVVFLAPFAMLASGALSLFLGRVLRGRDRQVPVDVAAEYTAADVEWLSESGIVAEEVSR